MVLRDTENNVTDKSHAADVAWEEWARLEPYYSVLTDPQYKLAAMDSSAKNQFFESGRIHVEGVLRQIRAQMAPEFNPGNVLDFGCGVGRLLVQFARIARDVVGLDVSPTMLAEAQKNCVAHDATNVSLLLSDDSLSTLGSRRFDLVHSAIVLQHIPTDRGKLIFKRLLACMAPRGVAALQLLYSKAIFSSNNGIAPEPVMIPKPKWYERVQRAPSDVTVAPSTPEMQMNPYNMNELLYFMQTRGISQFFSQFTDHGGELGLWLFFQAPG